jgi:hypothetical protein
VRKGRACHEIRFESRFVRGGYRCDGDGRDASGHRCGHPDADCVTEEGECLDFSGPSPTIPIIRIFKFNAPSAGTAQVTFHGSMYCANSGSTTEVVDVVTQIVTRGTALPDWNGPGGLRLAQTIESNTPFNKSDTFNLASTRVVPIPSAGVTKFFFKMTPLRVDDHIICFVFNATFSVVFVP